MASKPATSMRQTRDFYEVLVTGPNGFSSISSGVHTKMKIADLPIGVVLQAKVRGFNGKGPGEWSIPMVFSLAVNTNQAA